MNCHDCKKELDITKKGVIKGGVQLVYEGDITAYKCTKCYKKDPSLKNYQECEVYSRVVGYLRPIKQWNEAKVQEYEERKNYKI